MARPARGAPRVRPAPRGHVRRELAALERRPSKRFAQHFLAEPGIVRRIVDLAQLTGSEPVLEIGPGLGALTGELAARAGRLVLIELDRDFAARLRERFADAPHVTIIEQDVLKADLSALCAPGTTVVANLPYNISTPVLFALLDRADRFTRLVLMLQREVAERLRAQPQDRAYSALSVLVQFRARVRHGVHVAPAAFVPRPRVESEVIVLEPYVTPPVAVRDAADFRRVVRATFQQRRKQLINSLAGVTRDPRRALEAAGIDPTRRPETLSIAEFGRLADAVSSFEVAQASVPASSPAADTPDFYSYRRRLPHWRMSAATYFVTWRLGRGQQDLSPAERALVVSAVRHFDRQRYELAAYVVMNDHVHVVFSPLGKHQLQDIVRSWKSYTAHILQRQTGRHGSVWQIESFDRVVRDDAELCEKIEYIVNNARKRWPELTEYQWVWWTGGGER